MFRVLLTFILAVLPTLAHAQGMAAKAVIASPAGDTIPAGYPVMLDASASVCDPSQPLRWQVVRPPGIPVGTYDKGPRQGVAALIATLPRQDAVYTIAVTACVVDPQTHAVEVDTAVFDIHAEYAPTPTPVPPGPAPPIPGPVTGKLDRVLMVYESSNNMTIAQIHVLNSTAIRTALGNLLPKDGVMPAWRCWDKDVDVSRETPGWKQAWESVKGELKSFPCVVLFSGATHTVVPLPETEDAFLSLIGKKLGLR